MKKCIILFFIFLTLSSCKKTGYTIVNLNGNKISILGHAGMGFKNAYPINSYESVLKCFSLGADGTELDVQLTKDSVLVAYHDYNLSESTNLKGIINSLNWDEIKTAHYTQTPFLNYSIISVEQLFSNIKNLHNYRFTFDCKLYTLNNNTNQFYRSYINAMCNIIEKYRMENNVYIESSNEIFLNQFKNKKNHYSFLILSSTFKSGFDIALSLKLNGIHISTKNITKEQIKTAHNNNLWVAVWNTNSQTDHNEAIKTNPDIIISDNVKNLVKLLK